MNFESLVGRINHIQDALQAQAAHAVNLSLTARSWLVGYYIVEFEQHGEDRAKYGEKLLNRLSERINRKGFEPRRLREFRQLYLVYPVLGSEVAKYIKVNQPHLLESDTSSIWRSAPAQLQTFDNQENEKWRTAPAKLEEWSTPADRLFFRLNYTCLAYLASIEDPLKRAFYEQETIRGCWTSRELDRQVSSQYYERMGLSKDKKALQLNLYMNYFKHEVMQDDDNPPIGLLLCTDYGQTTVQYATEGLSQNLFVSKYRLQLPSEDDIRKYMLENITEEQFKAMMEEDSKK